MGVFLIAVKERKKMKKFSIGLTLILLIALSAVAVVGKDDYPAYTEYLRIHIRADSNETQAQAVKYKVKDAVVAYLTPYIAECDTKSKAESMIENRLSDIEAVADKVLCEQGFTYKSRAKINNEKFPTRNYGDYTLEQGYYDALILELGSGKGDNWWCVVYPPLCFTGNGTHYAYRSKILEIVKDFFG